MLLLLFVVRNFASPDLPKSTILFYIWIQIDNSTICAMSKYWFDPYLDAADKVGSFKQKKKKKNPPNKPKKLC